MEVDRTPGSIVPGARRATGAGRGRHVIYLSRKRASIMPLHRCNQQRDQGFQPLSADAVSCFPDNDQSLSYGVVINAPPGPGLRSVHDRVTPKKPFHMLATIPGYLGKHAP